MDHLTKPSKPLKPILKWAGGKRWLAPKLSPYWRSHINRCPTARLVEPFCGGLGIALFFMPQKALMNDINPYLINLYQQIKVGEFPIDMLSENDNNPITYYKNRDDFNKNVREGVTNTANMAFLFYYLTRSAFNGLCRFNQNGHFNAPYGKPSKIVHIDPEKLRQYQEIFSDWEFVCGDFERISPNADDFLYIDPPYDAGFTAYSEKGFKWDDQRRLVEWLLQFNNPTIVSNLATYRIIELYTNAGFDIEFITAPINISPDGNRDKAVEVLAFKNISHEQI